MSAGLTAARPQRTAPRTADAGGFKAASANARRPDAAAPAPAQPGGSGRFSPRPLSRSPSLPEAGWGAPVPAAQQAGGREAAAAAAHWSLVCGAAPGRWLPAGRAPKG